MSTEQQSSPNNRVPGSASVRRLGEVASCIRQTKQWFPVMRDYLRRRPLAYPYNLTLRSGEELALQEHTDTIIFWLIFARQHYPVDPSCRVILDIGANVGIFTVYAARQAPSARIICVEPFPDTCKRLRAHVEANGLQDRVTIVNCAITGTAGAGTMDSAAGMPSQYRRIQAAETEGLNERHRGTTTAQSQPTSEGVAVNIRTLGQILDECGIAAVDLVKMNIHGSEYDVLLRTDEEVLRRCRAIAVQYHTMPQGTKLGKEDIFDRLKSLGFRLVLDDDTRRGAGRALLAIPPFEAA